MTTDTEVPAPVGRPSSFTQELADAMCARLSDGESLRAVCRDVGMPDKATVFRWLRTNESFRDQYAIAKEESADSHADDLAEIADNGSNDWMVRNDPENAGYVANGEHIQRSRLRVETRKWIASKLKPKKYGDQKTVELTGANGGPLALHSVIEFVDAPNEPRAVPA